MADLLAHRGPDDREVLIDGPVGLAFTRLSLVDPTTGGQPLVSADGSLVLIANGEVYNHRELAAGLPAGTQPRTGSDCEVLLNLYERHGLDFLDRVRGMFGLILWDRRRGRLILARDRFGIKPLYFHRDGRRIVMASEIKALFADPATPRELDWQRALATPMLTAAPAFDRTPLCTWFEGVESVPAATILCVDLSDGTTREHRYWSFPGSPAEVRPAAEFIASYRDLLTESIRECATADAEIGLFLSGGVDSGIVAAIAAEQVPELHTFTVLNASTYRNGDAEHAHRLAGKIGVPNHQVVFDPARVPAPAEWKRLLWLLETPLCGPEVYYKHELHRYARQARPELRGMLLGAASDEFNGGYSVDLAGGGAWPDFMANITTMARRGTPTVLRWWAEDERPLLTDEVLGRCAGRDLGDAFGEYARWEYRKIQQYNVWHEDRTAAGSGIEARVPFLDHRLVELVAAVPASLREQLFWDKHILREAVRGLIPAEIAERPKVPFYYGSGLAHTYRVFLRMLAREDAALVEEALAAPGAREVVDADALRGTVRELGARRSGDHRVEIALHVINLGLLAGMVADLPAPTARTAAGSAPPAITVTDWDTQATELRRRIGLRPDIDVALVPRLAANVLLLKDTARPGDWYLTVDGSLEFVLDEADPDVVPLLRELDGVRQLADVLAGLDRTLSDVYEPLLELIEADVVELVEG
jgi:asparagine synthase (glutamine-hydrolysing)